MLATLLLPAGITSKASIIFKDESDLLKNVEEPRSFYINEILPQKMKYNLEGISKFGITNEAKLLFMTVFAVLGKDYSNDKFLEKDLEKTL